MTAEYATPRSTGPDAIPAELREAPNWLLWTFEEVDGRWTKVPRQISGYKASTTNPKHWTTFDAVYARLQSEEPFVDPDEPETELKLGGAGFALTPPWVGTDLDHCRDKATGHIEPWAQQLITRLDSYTELSPSGTGVHIFVRGKKPIAKSRKGSVEIYDHARYLTMTSIHLPGTPLTIEDRQDVLDAIHAELWPDGDAPAKKQTVPARVDPIFKDEHTLLEKIRQSNQGPKFIALYDHGDMGAHEDDHSRADLALCAILAFWTQNDPVQIDRLFRGSALYREKWDRKDYRDRTIDLVVGGQAYDPAYGANQTPQGVTVGGKTVYRGAALEALIQRPLPPFPLDALPDAFRRFVEEAAASFRVPAEFVAGPLLTVAGAAIGDSLQIAIKPGQVEGSNLYTVIVGKAGTVKTPVLKAVMQATQDVQAERGTTYARAFRAYEEDLQAYADAKRGEKGELPVKPILRSVMTTNATVEALILQLNKHNGLIYFSDEVIGIVTGMNQYKGGKGSDRQFYLTAWSRGAYVGHRKAGDEYLFVARPHVALLGGIQPVVLKEIDTGATDGMFDRICWWYPETEIAPVSWDVMSAETLDLVATVIRRLYDASEMECRTVWLSQDARDVYAAGVNDWLAQLRDDQFNTQFGGPWAKLSAQLARVALILHAIEDGGDTVSGRTMACALAIVRCMSAHILKVAVASRSERRGSKELPILEALMERGPMATAEIMTRVFKNNVDSALVRDALENLRERGQITSEEVKTGGRKALVWKRV